MSVLHPFAALRPRPDLAPRVCELPYDVMSEAEARRLADANPLSFLHVSRPEVGLPPGSDAHSDGAYAQAVRALDRLRGQGALVQDPAPCFYLYRQTMEGRSQTGIVAAASCQEYLDGDIRKHELTRPDKEDDRVRHIEALGAQTGPAFLFHRASTAVDAFVRARTALPPDLDFTAPDGIRHTTWAVADAAGIRAIREAFAAIPRLYIADGHHRSAAAGRVFRARGGAGASGGFLSVIFPHDALRILPYHRVMKDLNGHTPSTLLNRLGDVFAITPGGEGRPAGRHEVGLFLDGRWHTLRFLPDRTRADTAADRLEVALLQAHVLEPLLGIVNPRTSERIGFVGGIRGPGELERLVRSGEAACAFAMHPTGIDELMAVADAGGIMPPKSTWFEPKLRDALFSLLL